MAEQLLTDQFRPELYSDWFGRLELKVRRLPFLLAATLIIGFGLITLVLAVCAIVGGLLGLGWIGMQIIEFLAQINAGMLYPNVY